MAFFAFSTFAFALLLRSCTTIPRSCFLAVFAFLGKVAPAILLVIPPLSNFVLDLPSLSGFDGNIPLPLKAVFFLIAFSSFDVGVALAA